MKTSSCNRREFIGRSIVVGGGVALGLSSANLARGAEVKLSTPNAEKLGWRLCCQMYTFRDRSFYEAMDVLAGIGVRLVEPAFFLPLSKERPDLKTGESLSPEQRREMKKRMDDLGFKMPNYYGPLEGDKTQFRKIFDFAKEMGAETIVAEPPAEVFEALDDLCSEYKIEPRRA